MPKLQRRTRSTAPDPDEYREDDEFEDEASEDEQEEERPAKRRSSKPSRARDEDDETEDEDVDNSDAIATGWGGFDQTRKKAGGFADNLTISDEDQVIYFLESKPFANYLQHWINERQGKKSFICVGEDCPLCDTLGDNPRAISVFNIVLMDGGKPKVMQLEAGIKLATLIRNRDKNEKTGPLTRFYWAISKSGEKKKGGTTNYNLTPIKARDLEEEWEVEPLADDEIKALKKKAYGPKDIRVQSRKELKAVAAEVEDD